MKVVVAVAEAMEGLADYQLVVVGGLVVWDPQPNRHQAQADILID